MNKFGTKMKCNMMCTKRMRCRRPKCSLSCDYGLARNNRGCDVCKCQKSPCEVCAIVVHQNMLLVNRSSIWRYHPAKCDIRSPLCCASRHALNIAPIYTPRNGYCRLSPQTNIARSPSAPLYLICLLQGCKGSLPDL